MSLEHLDKSIRRIEDFPKPGITFYDITSILLDKEAFKFCIDEMTAEVEKQGATHLLAMEARGFIFAPPIAERLGLPMVLARKKGKLPGPTHCESYDLEYGTDTICVHKTDLAPGSKVFFIDDLIATGGTLKAAANLVEGSFSSSIAGIAAVIGLPFLGYSDILKGYSVRTIINFDSE
jgi:adenine phosphoribosyltransferase